MDWDWDWASTATNPTKTNSISMAINVKQAFFITGTSSFLVKKELLSLLPFLHWKIFKAL